MIVIFTEDKKSTKTAIAELAKRLQCKSYKIVFIPQGEVFNADKVYGYIKFVPSDTQKIIILVDSECSRDKKEMDNLIRKVRSELKKKDIIIPNYIVAYPEFEVWLCCDIDALEKCFNKKIKNFPTNFINLCKFENKKPSKYLEEKFGYIKTRDNLEIAKILKLEKFEEIALDFCNVLRDP